MNIAEDVKSRYTGVCDFLAEHWKPGAYVKIKDVNPELSAKVDSAYDELEFVWKEVVENKMLVNNFVLVLKKWCQVHVDVLDYLDMHGWSKGKWK